MNATKEFLFNVAIPLATDTYSPVSHANLLNATYEQLDKHNLIVKNEFFNINGDGRKLIGGLDIVHPDAAHLGMRLAFRNSYDKSMSVAFAAGAVAWICSNGMITGEIQYMRKHTGTVVNELNDKIITTINQLDDHFQKILNHSEQLHQIDLTKQQYAELMGRLYIIDKVIIPTQLSIISKEIEQPTFKDFEDLNAWSLYNHVTYALKNSHPTTYLDQHTNFHSFMEKEFQLN